MPDQTPTDPFSARRTLELAEGPTSYYDIDVLEEQGLVELDRLPFSIRVLLENALRHAGDGYVSAEHVEALMHNYHQNFSVFLP